MSLPDPLKNNPIVKVFASLLGIQADHDKEQRQILADRQHRDQIELEHARLEAVSRYSFARLHAESQLANREMDLRENDQRMDLAERGGLFQIIEDVARMAFNALTPNALRIKALESLVELTREQTRRSLGRSHDTINRSQLPPPKLPLLKHHRWDEDDD